MSLKEERQKEELDTELQEIFNKEIENIKDFDKEKLVARFVELQTRINAVKERIKESIQDVH